MIRDITLGQYYQADSVMHRMDPRTKIMATFIYIISLFIFTNKYVYILALAILLIGKIFSNVPMKFILRGMRPIIVLLLFTACFNLFLVDGDILVSWWIIKISKQGLRIAAYMVTRLILLIFSSSILTLTTTPSNLTDGLEKVLAPLKIFKVPVHEIAMIMAIALRFIPILLEETDKIMKAQLARGADFETGNIFRKAKALIPMLIPLFVSAFRRANDLAMAMEARCYRGDKGRTKMKPLRYSGRDYITYLILIVYLALIIICGKYGYLIDVRIEGIING